MKRKKTWKLKLYDKYFQLIKQGKKTVEGRAGGGSQDFSKIRRGDTIIFVNLDSGEKLKAVVEIVLHYTSVKDMIDVEGLQNVLPGAKNIVEGIIEYHKIPGYRERIKKFGIWAIRFELK